MLTPKILLRVLLLLIVALPVTAVLNRIQVTDMISGEAHTFGLNCNRRPDS